MYDSYNPFLQIIKSFEGIAHSDTYYKLRKQTTGSKILCALITAFLLCLITFGIGAAKLCNDKNLAYFLSSMPDYKYENGSLYVEKKFEDSSTTDTYFLVDTSVPYYYTGTDDNNMFGAVNAESIIQKAGEITGIHEAVIASETNLIRVTYSTGQVQNIKYSEIASILHLSSFSKSAILSGYKGFIAKWAAIIGAICLPIQFALIFFSSLVYCIISQISKSVVKANDDFNTIYWISFYVYTAFIIIKTLIKNVIPFSIRPINTIFFAMIIFIIAKTLKEGDSDTGAAQFGYVNNDTFPDTFDNTQWNSTDNFDNTQRTSADAFNTSQEGSPVYTQEEPVNDTPTQTEAPKSTTGLSLRQ